MVAINLQFTRYHVLTNGAINLPFPEAMYWQMVTTKLQIACCLVSAMGVINSNSQRKCISKLLLPIRSVLATYIANGC